MNLPIINYGYHKVLPVFLVFHITRPLISKNAKAYSEMMMKVNNDGDDAHEDALKMEKDGDGDGGDDDIDDKNDNDDILDDKNDDADEKE